MNDRNKDRENQREDDTINPRHKGEEQHNPQKGALGVSDKQGDRHRKDESEGAERNTTKKGPNSI